MQSCQGKRKHGVLRELQGAQFCWHMQSDWGGFIMKLMKQKLWGPSQHRHLQWPVSIFFINVYLHSLYFFSLGRRLSSCSGCPRARCARGGGWG